MTTVYTSCTVTGPDGEPLELELAAEVSADGEVIGLHTARLVPGYHVVREPVPEWAVRQIDMGDLADEVRQRLKARERGWP